MSDSDYMSEVVKMISDIMSIEQQTIKAEHSLEGDLGMTGDDARYFLELYKKRFEINMNGFTFYKYFYPEFYISFLRKFLYPGISEHDSRSLTVKHLIDVAKRKQWYNPT
jgi:hypothetical protein